MDRSNKPATAKGNEPFVNVWLEQDADATTEGHRGFYGRWSKKASSDFSSPPLFGANVLRHLYPDRALVMTKDYKLNFLNFPAVQSTPLEDTPLVTNLFFIPFARKLGGVPGVLVDQVQFGAFKLSWEGNEYILFSVTYPAGFNELTQHYILHEGPEDNIRLLLISTGAWAEQLHDEIWVFDQGFWSKNHNLWVEVQKANWADVILKEPFKKSLQNDINGFFASEAMYKKLAIPWKRGLIILRKVHLGPGNGKTISLKAVMKECGAKGFQPLYVKSFQSWRGEEGAMADVFDKARQLSPCVVIIEDLDSLINDRNRSFFLNQLDGIEGNDGLLIIGTTNHFDRLDPGLSSRPSRFDRKYEFDDPDRDERILYVQYWQSKLQDNQEIEFPDALVTEVADLTHRFSFAYLKEAFVATLVTFAGLEKKSPFADLLKDQIMQLRKQIDRTLTVDVEADDPSLSEQPIHKHAGWLWDAWTESDLKRKMFAAAAAADPNDPEKKFSFWPNFTPVPTDATASAATRSYSNMMPNVPWTPGGSAPGIINAGLFAGPNMFGLPGQR